MHSLPYVVDMTLILLAPATTALQSYFGLANAIHTLQMSWYNSELTAFSSLNNLNSSITQVMRLENVLFFTFALMHSIICKYYHIEGLPCVLCSQSSLICLHSFVPENTEALCHSPPSSFQSASWNLAASDALCPPYQCCLILSSPGILSAPPISL